MAVLASFTWLECATVFLLCNFVYMITLVFYRLWLSPTSSFPGPFMARVTFLYEFYYQWFRTGTYYLKIKEMHDSYGMNSSSSNSCVGAYT